MFGEPLFIVRAGLSDPRALMVRISASLKSTRTRIHTLYCMRDHRCTLRLGQYLHLMVSYPLLCAKTERGSV